MLRRLTGSFVLASVMAAGAVILDRIEAVVGGHAIKASDIDRDVRITEFINTEPLNVSDAARRQSAQRLIDQQLIRDELRVGGYDRPAATDAGALVAQIRGSRFGGSDARMQQGLAQYGISEDELRTRLLWQLTVLSFIDQRFRPGVLVTDQDVRNYYEQHRAELERQYPGQSFEAIAPKVREKITAEQINQQFFAWLDQRRKDVRIRFVGGDLQ